MPKAKKVTTKKIIPKKKGLKKVKEAKPVEKIKVEIKLKPERYFEAVGRRKTALARVRLFTKGERVFLVNEKPLENHFPTSELQEIARVALEKMKCLDKFGVSAIVKGGGLHARPKLLGMP